MITYYRALVSHKPHLKHYYAIQQHTVLPMNATQHNIPDVTQGYITFFRGIRVKEIFLYALRALLGHCAVRRCSSMRLSSLYCSLFAISLRYGVSKMVEVERDQTSRTLPANPPGYRESLLPSSLELLSRINCDEGGLRPWNFSMA